MVQTWVWNMMQIFRKGKFQKILDLFHPLNPFGFNHLGFSFFVSWSALPSSSALLSSPDESLISSPLRDNSSSSLRRPVATSRSSSTSCVACSRKYYARLWFGNMKRQVGWHSALRRFALGDILPWDILPWDILPWHFSANPDFKWLLGWHFALGDILPWY